MERIQSPDAVTVSYDHYGSGTPLVLVHGSFSDHDSNWEVVRPLFAERFHVYAIARRGRGETDATEGHRLEDEARDVAAVIHAIGEPVFLLGHSYGALTALEAASEAASHVRKLVLYEPPRPHRLREVITSIESLAEAGDWDGYATSFFRDGLSVPAEELEEVRRSALWAPILADAPATRGDLRALYRYAFEPERFRKLQMPVLLQVGTASPRQLYATDPLAAVLPDVRIEELAGQAHEGMTTAPEMYAEAVSRFLLG